MLTLIACMASVPSGVTVSTGGETLEKLLADISRQSGERLTVSPSLSKDILICAAQEVPVKSIVDRIADVEDATWQIEGDGLKLYRTENQWNAQQRTEEQNAAADLDHEISNLHKQNSRYNLNFCQILDALGSRGIARLPVGERIVYAFAPTSQENQLPTYLYGRLTDDSVQAFANNYLRHVTSPVTNLGDARLIVSLTRRSPQSIQVFATTHVANAYSRSNGQFIDSAWQPLPGPERPGDSNQKLVAINDAVSRTPTREELLNPEKFDPLCFYAAPCLWAVAEQEGSALIARLPDDVPLTKHSDHEQILTTRQIRNEFGSRCTFDETHPGWLVVKPRFPVYAREIHSDRALLGEFSRKVDRDNGTSVEDLARFASSSPRLLNNSLTPDWLSATDPAMHTLLDPMRLPSLRIFAALSTSQRTTLRRSGTISARDLPPEAVNELNRWILNDTALANSSRVDPVEAFPDGITDRIYLKSYASGEPQVEERSSDVRQTWGTLSDKNSIAVSFALSSATNAHGPSGGLFRLCDAETINVSIEQRLQAGNRGLVASQIYGSIARTKEWVKYKELPSDFRRDIDRLVAQFAPIYRQIMSPATSPAKP